MQHLFSAWKDVARELRAARQVLLLCDYDGTLTPIVDRPELADLPGGTRQLLQALKSLHGVTVGIVSGRALADLKARVGIRDLVYAGNHGMEIEGPGISFVSPLAEEMRPALNLMGAVLGKALGAVKGAFVENKGLTLSVHYRAVDEDKAHEVKNIFERVVATPRSLGKVKTTSGKKVYEVRPHAGWDKGKAVELLIKRYGKSNQRNDLLPVYLGDDQTDEDGFSAIQKHGHGLSVLVGVESAGSAARFFLRDPAEVEQFLDMVLKAKAA